VPVRDAQLSAPADAFIPASSGLIAGLWSIRCCVCYSLHSTRKNFNMMSVDILKCLFEVGLNAFHFNYSGMKMYFSPPLVQSLLYPCHWQLPMTKSIEQRPP
jgi:hypothetical protein